jgi:hypothetical protein
MPRSSKAPEPPPEPDINELIQNDVARIKRLLGLDVNRLALGSEVEGIVTTGLNPGDYTITGVNVIEFVDVSTSLGPSQGGTPPPPQVTGLTTNVISNTQINLAWTAYGGSDFNFYTVYRGTATGFSADSSSDIATPTTNSYNNTGLTAGTTYYYRVATTNDASLEGPLSSEVSGTTTGDTTPPGQVTGLTATVISDTQINLAWTASGAGDLNHYDVHRSTTTGFTPAVGNRISQPTTNSYNNTGLTASTTYYYKVAAVDNASNIGTYSTQATGTTQSPTINPSLELHFDGNLTDTSPNGHVFDASSTNNNGYLSPGQFGSSAKKINYPTSSPGDILLYADVPTLRMDPTVGFSISVWVYPVSGYTGNRKTIIEKKDDANNMWNLQVEPSSLLVHFQVMEAGTVYKRVTAAGLTINAWNHIVATFNSSSNTIAIYNAAVAGNSSSAATQWDSNNSSIILILGSSATDINNTKFLGYIDELRYYKGTVLTPTQVTNLMNTNDT